MTLEIAVFPWVPPFAQGYVRDLRPRWAAEEAGLAYDEVLVRETALGSDYRQWQPFGQVPACRDGELEFFESASLVLHIARRSEVMRPRDAQEAAQTEAWAFAAMNSVEPAMMNMVFPVAFCAGEPWVEGFLETAEKMADRRLASLAGWLEEREWLVGGRFGAADILMATVLREIEDRPVLARHAGVKGYMERCLARPAFGRAIEAQMATFAAHAPKEAAVAEG